MSCQDKNKQVEDKVRAKTACEELIEHLFQYVDNELDEKMIDRLSVHLSKCAHCKDYSEAEKHIRRILKKKCCDKAPSELKDRIHSQLLLLNNAIHVDYEL